MDILPAALKVDLDQTLNVSRSDEIRQSAQEFEAVFVRQMLEYAGIADAFGAGGNTTTDSFAPYILEALATDIVEKGGFGIADQVYAQLAERQVADEGETKWL